MKRRLDAAAEHSGRSQSQEAELRLERSFERNDLLPEVLSLAYGKPMAGILMMVGYVMARAGMQELWSRAPYSDQRFNAWMDDRASFDQARLAAAALLASIQPEGGTSELGSTIGIRVANEAVRSITRKSTDQHIEIFTGYSWTGDTLRALLGPIAARMREPRVAPALQQPSGTGHCPWCDHALSDDQFKAVLTKVRVKLREADMAGLLDLIAPKLDAEVCTWCDHSISPARMKEIIGTAKQLNAKLQEQAAQQQYLVTKRRKQ